MSLVFTRWQALLYYSNTDVADVNYNSLGEVDKTVLDTASFGFVTINISKVGYQFSPTHELAQDIGGKPYSKNRGFVDSWNLTLTPYYFADTGSYASVLSVSSDVASSIKYRHLWLYILGVQQESSLITDDKAVKVVFNAWSESINNATASRTAELSFRRKYRVD